MAVTKTHPIKSTLKAAIDYICNPDKTDGKLLVSSPSAAPPKPPTLSSAGHAAMPSTKAHTWVAT